MGRPDPLQELLNIQERINRLFEESIGRGRATELPAFGSGGFTPLADAYETPDAYVVLIELPGVEREDLEIGVAERVITVKGHRRLSASVKPESFYRMERSYGAFMRSFRFTEAVDASRMGAHLAEGLLRLDLPKVRVRADWRARAERSG